MIQNTLHGHSGSASDFAVQFDGVDDFVSSEAPILNELSEFTMSGWVNFTESQGNRTGLFGQNDLVEFGMINANQMQLWTSTAGAVNVSLGPTSDGWRHIVVNEMLKDKLFTLRWRIRRFGWFSCSTSNFRI